MNTHSQSVFSIDSHDFFVFMHTLVGYIYSFFLSLFCCQSEANEQQQYRIRTSTSKLFFVA